MYTTCSRELASKALLEADQAFEDLTRIFGITPIEKPHFLVTRSSDQYQEFAQGDSI